MTGTVVFEQQSEQSPTTVTWDIEGHDPSAERGIHVHECTVPCFESNHTNSISDSYQMVIIPMGAPVLDRIVSWSIHQGRYPWMGTDLLYSQSLQETAWSAFRHRPTRRRPWQLQDGCPRQSQRFQDRLSSQAHRGAQRAWTDHRGPRWNR